jgi:iron complex transport system substrate-binding protein
LLSGVPFYFHRLDLPMTATIRALIIASVTTLLLGLPALAQEFPFTIEHKFGTTVIPDRPERVASVDYRGIGNLLAIGVSPFIVRDWRDDFPFTTPPWGGIPAHDRASGFHRSD